MSKYVVQAGQTIFDVCVEKYGSLEALFSGLLHDNPTLNLNSTFEPGQEISIKTAPTQKTVVDYFKARSLTINTGETQDVGSFEFSTDFSTAFNS